jgi:hypothetical protein
MSNKLDSEYVGSALQILEKRCLTLLCEGYNEVVSMKKISVDWEEEDISMELILCLEGNQNRKTWNISINPEHRLYSRHTVSAKKAPRIDFSFSCWMPQEYKYFAEAKILIETDVHKTGRKSKTTAKSLLKRYIKTGIDSYLSGKYPVNGCLVGYVLQGKIENIIDCLNRYLCDFNRITDVLQKQSFELNGFDNSYVSTHDNTSIKHLMFDLSATI